MGLKTFNLPDPGEGLTEAEIVTWMVKPGDAVKVNDVVVEIETSKSLVELPIPWEGTVGELLVAEGQEVPVGAPIITIEVAGVADDPAPAQAPAPAPAEPEPAPAQADSPSTPDGWAGAADDAGAGDTDGSGSSGSSGRTPNLVGYGAIGGSTTRRARKNRAPGVAASAGGAGSGPVSGPSSGPARPLAKPPVRKYAKDQGVDLAEVTGSGEGGIIDRGDADAHLASGGTGSTRTSVAREERILVKGVRKMTAAAMTGSAFGAPHVTEFVTIDMTASMELLDRLKVDREFRDVKVTPLLLVAKALLLACRRNPGVNATWEEAGDQASIVLKNYVNLGIAAATPRGLIVPNVKDADAMSLRELAGALTVLVETARAGRTQPADMAGGTITITNVGVFGVDTGTPIINPGESAILAFGAVRRMPWVVGSGAQERIEPRWVTQLALSFDHRLIDGDLGSRFLADIAAVLHDPARALLWA